MSSLYAIVPYFIGMLGLAQSGGNRYGNNYQCYSDITPPRHKTTCIQISEWNECDEPWVKGYCCLSCSTACDDECENAQWQCQSDNPPTIKYTCPQRAEWRQCNNTFMRGYCCNSCPESCQEICAKTEVDCQTCKDECCPNQPQGIVISEEPAAIPTIPLELCPQRCRRSWQELGQSERNLYINAFQELSAQNTVQQLASQYDSALLNPASIWLPYHRVMIHEMEKAIHGLGGEYECFAMPFWYVITLYMFLPIYGTSL